MKLIGYVRVSSEEQAKKFGPSLQRADIERWAEAGGHTVVAWESDDGVPGTAPLDQREGLLRAVARCARERCAGVVFWKRDRWTRDPVETAVVEDMLRRVGARAYSVDGNNEDGPEAALMRFIMDAFSKYEAVKIRMRTHGGKRQAVARGHTWSSAPYGYVEAEPGVMAVDPGPAEVVRRILERRAHGETFAEIAAGLNAENVPPPWISKTTRRGRGREYGNTGWTLFSVRKVCDRERFYRGEVDQLGTPILPGAPSHVALLA